MTKYLYGAAVQGIQAFIFQTNKLKEIIGASELVEQICTSQFAEQLGKNPGGKDNEFLKKALEDDSNCIIAAAGNIKYIFESDTECKKMVREFPKRIMNFAPGITISQAVVELEDGELKKDSVSKLEQKLKIQRNKPSNPTSRGLMAIERSRRTGLPGYKYVNDKKSGSDSVLDEATYRKIKVAEKQGNGQLCDKLIPDEYGVKKENLGLNVDEISDTNDKSFVAVIHADGNSLGSFIQQLGNDNLTSDERIKCFKNLSIALDRATITSSKNAFQKVFAGYVGEKLERGSIPIRPIIIGGDDLTVICKASKAVEFTKVFLQEFEVQTEIQFDDLMKDFLKDAKIKKLTACAGIAFVKDSFPFHYAVDLAEALCGEAKKASKGLQKDNPKADKNNDVQYVVPSLAFHKLEGSHYDDFADIKERVLQIGELSMYYGPYCVNRESYNVLPNELVNEENYSFVSNIPLLSKLENACELAKHENAPISQMRQWLSKGYENEGSARVFMERTISVLKTRGRDEFVTGFELDKLLKSNDKTMVYDILSLTSLQGGN